MAALGVKVYKVVAVLLMAGDQTPVIPLSEVVGSVKLVPEQTGCTCVKVGVCAEFTVTVMVVVGAQGCMTALGVKVYKVVVVLLMAGDQTPVIPLSEVVGRVKLAPEQIGCTCVKLGVAASFTVTVIVLTLAHWSALGVKVYTWEPAIAVLMTAGDQVPVIGGVFVELEGKTPGVAFWQ